MVREQIGSALLVRLSGSFDLPQALELRDELAGIDGEVILDFSQVEDLRVHALGIVAQASNGHTHLLGLRQHHTDVLGYLGFEVDERGRLTRRSADATVH
jgi:anti-anti-sigma regulatory factor